MKKFIIIILALLTFAACENKKKKNILPLLALTQAGSASPAKPGTNSGTDTTAAGETTPATTATNSAAPTATQTTNDSTGTVPFTYQTSETVPVSVTVTDSNSPVEGAIVTISDGSTGEPNILLQGVTNASGTVSGTITVSTTVTQVQAEINLGTAVVTQPVNLTNVVTVNRQINVVGDYNPASQIADADKDGIPDADDFYPNDITRATKIRFPVHDSNTIAFEDLYPSAGDADLNDYVITFANEEDLNGNGKVARIRGTYQHIAKGAGYKHKLKIKFPGITSSASYKKVIYNANGSVSVPETISSVTATDLINGLEILPDSSTTISSSNSSPGQTFAAGKKAVIEITFDTPVSKSLAGTAPYDLYMFVISTGQDVHFPGLYKNADQTDKFLDVHGFPWAIQIPGIWKYPYEGLDIRNSSKTGYGQFSAWASSLGVSNKNWYETVTDSS
ncbi:MAG: LruC domain-containing protein, partial [Leptospira sp.]|nr:LruC domain-containing protein [Leptospira sp.]